MSRRSWKPKVAHPCVHGRNSGPCPAMFIPHNALPPAGAALTISFISQRGTGDRIADYLTSRGLTEGRISSSRHKGILLRDDGRSLRSGPSAAPALPLAGDRWQWKATLWLVVLSLFFQFPSHNYLWAHLTGTEINPFWVHSRAATPPAHVDGTTRGLALGRPPSGSPCRSSPGCCTWIRAHCTSCSSSWVWCLDPAGPWAVLRPRPWRSRQCVSCSPLAWSSPMPAAPPSLRHLGPARSVRLLLPGHRAVLQEPGRRAPLSTLLAGFADERASTVLRWCCSITH